MKRIYLLISVAFEHFWTSKSSSQFPSQQSFSTGLQAGKRQEHLFGKFSLCYYEIIFHFNSVSMANSLLWSEKEFNIFQDFLINCNLKNIFCQRCSKFCKLGEVFYNLQASWEFQKNTFFEEQLVEYPSFNMIQIKYFAKNL